jgi:group I intron endonuclease
MGYIYKITHKDSGRMYIGQTSGNLHDRWRNHCKNNSNCTYLKNSIKKYGKYSFNWEIICICFDEDLNRFEREYIEKYKTLAPLGFNLSSGGNNGNKHHAETKVKISVSVKRAKNSPDFIHPRYQLGKPHTTETKNKISEKLKGRIFSEDAIAKRSETRTMYRVVQTKDGIDLKVYKSLADASNELGINKISIHSVCKGKRKSAGGFQWRQLEKSEII